MIKYSYASEKFSDAVSFMATVDAPLRRRLVSAVGTVRHLDLDMLPESLREDFAKITQRNPNTMSDSELSTLADKIVAMMFELKSLYYEDLYKKSIRLDEKRSDQ